MTQLTEKLMKDIDDVDKGVKLIKKAAEEV